MARMRSPNFPGLPLESAINAAKAIWEKNRRAPIMREAAAKDLGYTGLTGRSLKILGALNQYDLIENTSNGQMRVTKTAEDILVGYPEHVKRDAVTKAGRAPSLFQDIFDKFEGVVPGENAVRSILFQKGFTNEGVEKALKSFLETNRYVEINGSADGAKPTPSYDLPPSSSSEEKEDLTEDITETELPKKKEKVSIFEAGPLDFQLSTNGLRLTGKTNSANELKAFIAKLAALAVLLPEDDSGRETQ